MRFRRRRSGPDRAISALSEALQIVAASDTDVVVSERALWVIGRHYAIAVDLPSDTVALAVNKAGHSLAAGVSEACGRLPTHSVVTHVGQQDWHPIKLQWLTARPPADKPLLVLAELAITGGDVKAVLDCLVERRDGDLGEVTVLVARSRPAGLAAIRDAHPDVSLITARQLAQATRGQV